MESIRRFPERPALTTAESVKLSRSRVDDPDPIPSIWKLATSAPSAHPREKSELTVLLITDSTPSNQTE